MPTRLQFLGEHFFNRNSQGKPISVATIFLGERTIVTLPGIHATQRVAMVDAINARRASQGQPPLSREEEMACWMDAVDLIVEGECVLIRPDPDNMPQAFEADELLESIVPKTRIKFLHTLNGKVRDAIKRRGELWRINPLPRSAEDMVRLINSSRIGIGGREVYYYNKDTGTRWLTSEGFASLGTLSDEELRSHLVEVQRHAAKFNSQHAREVDFFPPATLTAAELAPYSFENLEPALLRAAFETLQRNFEERVPIELRHDDPKQFEWRNQMCDALVGHVGDAVSEEKLLGMSPEFFLQIEWLPGGRLEDDELIFDPVLDNTADGRFADDKPRKFIFNFVRQYFDLEYVNIGRVIGSLSRRRPFLGRRGVYIAQVKQRGSEREIISVIRMQKWTVREHLDDCEKNYDLETAMCKAEEYTEYVFDRRLGCRQLGMHLPSRLVADRIEEIYHGYQEQRYGGRRILTPYFERDYVGGIATDKVPAHRFQDETFAAAFGRVLGRAAAPNLIVGRCDDDHKALFDDGDEVVVEDAARLPIEIIVADQTGTFVDYDGELVRLAPAYAGPVNRRAGEIANLEAFASAYLEAFAQRMAAIQQEYRRRRRAFDTLFSQRRRDEAGSFAYRWERVLARLDRADPRELRELIRANFNGL